MRQMLQTSAALTRDFGRSISAPIRGDGRMSWAHNQSGHQGLRAVLSCGRLAVHIWVTSASCAHVTPPRHMTMALYSLPHMQGFISLDAPQYHKVWPLATAALLNSRLL